MVLLVVLLLMNELQNIMLWWCSIDMAPMTHEDMSPIEEFSSIIELSVSRMPPLFISSSRFPCFPLTNERHPVQ